MSNWIEIKDKTDLEYNDRKRTVDILIGSDDSGNNYVSIPAAFLRDLLNIDDPDTDDE